MLQFVVNCSLGPLDVIVVLERVVTAVGKAIFLFCSAAGTAISVCPADCLGADVGSVCLKD